MCFWQKFLENVIDDFKHKGNNFNRLEEMKIITIANNMDMSYDFYIRHNNPAVEWKLHALINKNPNLINKYNRNWRHPLNRKFKTYRI